MGALIVFAIFFKALGPGIGINQSFNGANQYCHSIGLKQESCLTTRKISEYVYSDEQGQVYIVSTSKVAPYIDTIEKYDPKIHRLKRKNKWE